MPRVQVPQYGTYIDFPDDVTPEQMTAVLTEHFPKRAAAKLAPTAGEALVEGLKSGATYKGYFAPGMPLANMNGGDQIPSESMAGPSYLTPPPAPTDAHAGIPDIPPPTAEELAVARLRRMGINVPDTPPEEPSFAARMAGSVGGIIGTAPEFAVGAVPGALVGGPAGGAIGGFAATGGLTEAQNPESGVGRVALSTAQGAGEGSLMAAGGAAGGAIGAGAGKVAQVAGHALGAAAGLGVSPVLHGQAPTVQSFADALAMVALFEGVGGIHAVARGRERVLAGEKAGETPQQAFEAARQEVVPEPVPPEGGFRVSSTEAPISPVETPQPQVTPEPTTTPEVIPQAAPEAIPAPAAPVQPKPETVNGQKAANEAQGQRQAAKDVLTQPAGATESNPAAPAPKQQAPEKPARQTAQEMRRQKYLSSRDDSELERLRDEFAKKDGAYEPDHPNAIYLHAIDMEIERRQGSKKPARNTSTPQPKVESSTPFVEPTALQAFPDMNEVPGGGYAINNFAPHEAKSMRDAGIISVNSEGHEVADAEALWEQRKAIQSLSMREQERLLAESKDRMFSQQPAGGESPTQVSPPATSGVPDNFADFEKEYRRAFAQMNKYGPDKVGGQIAIDRMAELNDANPKWVDAIENRPERQKAYKAGSPELQAELNYQNVRNADLRRADLSREGFDAQPEIPNAAPAPVEPAPPAATPEQPAPEQGQVSAVAPIRFKRTGSGDTAVHEATVEGRPVSISKGKDGWEVRLDGQVADVHPTLAKAREYATGELRQDLVDQRNAAEEEARASQPDWLVEAMQREGKNPGRLLHEVDLGNRSVSDALKNDPIVAQMLSVEPELGARALKGNVSASEVSDFIKRNPPAPADTGIFRDLTAAAREGKRFVEELHARIAPVLARIHAQAKSATDFVRQAVAKIGEHIRPYAKRFLADVKRGVRDETGARITGKGLTEGIKARFGKERKPLANPGTTPESRGFVDKVDTERAQPDAQTREQWERAADSLDRAEVWDALRKNKLGGKGPEWTIAAKRLTDEAAWNALQDGKNVADAWHVADDYRRTGTAIAREFSARYDPVLSPTERAQVAKANKELADLNTQMDDPNLSDAEHSALMERYANTQQRINDIRTVGTARRMLSEIFTSPRKKTATTLKKLDKVIADRTTSEPERARKQAERDKVSKEEGRALEVMRRRMIKSGIPLDDPVAMTKRDNILRALSEAKAHKSTVVDKFEELYKNLMFSGSTPLNVIDNGIIMGNEFLVNRPLEMAINKALNLDPKAAGFDDTPYMLAALAPGLRRGVRNMIDSWRTEADMFELQTHGPNMNMSGKLEGRGAAITGRLGRTVRSMGYRPLMATDSFNKSVVAELEVAAYANRLANIRGLEGRAKTRFMQRQSLDYDSESWQHAVGRAENLTLTDEAGVVTKAVTELRDKIWPLRFLIPVVKTPSKALAMTLRKTPLGSARVAAKMYSDPLYTRKALAHDLAEQAAAWTVALGLYAMLRTGDKDAPGLPRITGNQPYSRKHYAEDKNKAMIAPPRSIRLGDKWYGYGTLGVVAGQIATTVDLLDALAEAKDDPLPALSNFMAHFMGNARDRTYLGSIDDIGQALEEGGLPKWATNFAGSWSPSALKKVVRMADPKERETRALDTQGKLSYKIFPFSDMAPAKVDLMGHEISKSPEDGPRSDILWRILPQSSVVDLAARDPLETNVYRMFINWNNQHPDKRWAPDAPQLSYKDGNEMKQWTPQQYHDLSMKAGGWASVMLKKINEKRPFNFDAPTEADKAVVDDVFKSGREYAKGVMLGELKKQKP